MSNFVIKPEPCHSRHGSKPNSVLDLIQGQAGQLLKKFEDFVRVEDKASPELPKGNPPLEDEYTNLVRRPSGQLRQASRIDEPWTNTR